MQRDSDVNTTPEEKKLDKGNEVSRLTRTAESPSLTSTGEEIRRGGEEGGVSVHRN